ncbi:MAG: hypothetical protein M0030_18780 [Actinomycetota bacterium]|nr:hypothetical protein [Actinomycetota bacterium]
MSAPVLAGELAALAGWVDDRIDDGTDLQWLADRVAVRLRDMAAEWLGSAEPGRRAGTGPFDSEAQVRELPAVRAIWDRRRAAYPRPEASAEIRAAAAGLIEAACERSGVMIGAYDRRLIGWLAGFSPEYCAVFAGLISRAGSAR